MPAIVTMAETMMIVTLTMTMLAMRVTMSPETCDFNRLRKLLKRKVPTRPRVFEHGLDLGLRKPIVRNAALPAGLPVLVSLVRGKVDDEEHAAGLEPLHQALRGQLAIVKMMPPETYPCEIEFKELSVCKRSWSRVGWVGQVATVCRPRRRGNLVLSLFII